MIGAGPIGLGAALFAGIAGADVAILDRDAARRDFAVQNGIAVQSIEAGAGTDARVAEITNGEGFDLVFDATGNRASREGAFRHGAHGGTLVLVSSVTDNITFSDPEFH